MQKNKITNPSVFKKYDIRGIVNQDLIIDEIYQLTRAIATYLKQQEPVLNTLIVGMDGRTHSAAIKEHVCAALQDHGINVIFIGTCTTPAFYYANEILNASGGIMITASHNPKEYNGLKIRLNKENVFDQEIVTIKNIFFANHAYSHANVHGTYQEQDVITPYILLLEYQFKHLKNIQLKAIIDCAHGATATIIPTLVKRMGWNNMQVLYGTIDGTFPAHEADPTKEENILELRNLVRQQPETVGISFDGDGDRFLALTENGAMLRGDELSTIFCQAIKKELGSFKLAIDIKCSSVLLAQLHAWELEYILTPCGVGFVRKAMQKTTALFGGELSCHFCFADRYFGYDDGIYAMMRLIEFLTLTQKSLQEVSDQLPARFCSPELRINCTNDQKFAIVEQIKQQVSTYPNSRLITIDGIRLELPNGCITLRASNTEPVLSLRFEGSNQKNLDLITREFSTLLLPHFDRAYLEKTLNLTGI